TSQRWEHRIDPGASLAARRNGYEFDPRMLRQQPQQLDTGISGAPDDADLDPSAHRPPFQSEVRTRIDRMPAGRTMAPIDLVTEKEGPPQTLVGRPRPSPV